MNVCKNVRNDILICYQCESSKMFFNLLCGRNCSLQHHPGLDLQTFKGDVNEQPQRTDVENLEIKTIKGLLGHLPNSPAVPYHTSHNVLSRKN